jgi:hypothetical protein
MQPAIHQKRLFAMIEAAIAFIALLLPWTTYKVQLGFFGGGGSIPSNNGFRSWGFLVLLGILGVFVCSIMGDRTKNYENNLKLGAMGSFGAIVLGAIIYLIRVNSYGQLQDNFGNPVSANGGVGLWIAMLAGIIGILWVGGVLDQIMKPKPGSPANPAPSSPPSNPAPPATPQS